MRIAVVSDIHGNRTAFDAVLTDLRETSPDLILHGGDVADAGPGGASIVDRIRDLGWPGVIGNTDEMLARPESLEEFAAQTPAMQPLLPVIREMAASSREALGEERIAWLGALPLAQRHGDVALVHASPKSPWRSPNPEASDADFESAYAPLDRQVVVYGHIHRSFLRTIGTRMVANSGSVSLSYDGDPRAAYLLIEGGVPQIRRVAYDVDREVRALKESGGPHWEWIAKILLSASPQMP